MNKWYLISVVIMTVFSHSVLAQGKFSGYMFGDYFYNVTRDSRIASLPNAATGGEKSDQAFLFRRIYFTYDNDISEKFTSRFRLEGGNGTLASDGKFSVFVKDAYLRWKGIFEGSDLFFGIHPTPAFQVSEKVWGYRSLEKTILDLRKVVSSRDFGLALNGKFDKGGIFNYWIMVANGSGNAPEFDKHKRYYLTFYVKPTKNLSMSLYGDYADRGKTVDKYTNATVSNGTFTTAAFMGYAEKKNFSVGIEGFLSTGLNQFDDGSSVRALRTMGISLFGSVHLVSQVVLVGRYDYYDPNINGKSKGDTRHYILGAVEWKPDDNVSIMPNVQVETYDATAGSIDPSITGRLTFYYVFL